MELTLHDTETLDGDAEAVQLLHATIDRALCFQHTAKADVYLAARTPLDAPDYKNPGWLEFGLKLTFSEGGYMYIGCLQRRPGEQFEFHS